MAFVEFQKSFADSKTSVFVQTIFPLLHSILYFVPNRSLINQSTIFNKPYFQTRPLGIQVNFHQNVVRSLYLFHVLYFSKLLSRNPNYPFSSHHRLTRNHLHFGSIVPTIPLKIISTLKHLL